MSQIACIRRLLSVINKKSKKISNPDNQNGSEDAVAGSSNVKSSPEIFKLSIDCFDELFEYLSIKDLYSFGQTCKRMKKVAGEYFKRNHKSAGKICEKDRIYTCTVYSDKDGVIDKRIKTSGFIQFMPFIVAEYENNSLRYIQSHVSEFESTNHIFLLKLDIIKKDIKVIKKLLLQLDILEIYLCSVHGDFYESMLKYCVKLKEIHFECSYVEHNGWLLHEYPKLERLELISGEYLHRTEELGEFFARNPKLQKFSTTPEFLWINSDIFLNSKAKLDILEIKRIYARVYFMGGDEYSFVALLNKLHEQGFYKRLYIDAESYGEVLIDFLATLRGFELLTIAKFQRSSNLPQLSNLRELIILDGSNVTDMEILANSLVKLERLYIGNAGIGDIMPFIRRSSKLNKIKCIPKKSFNGVLNLTMLNGERAKCERARKITIYTRDDVFLATKWATTNGDTNLSLIEMRRSNSYDWNRHC